MKRSKVYMIGLVAVSLLGSSVTTAREVVGIPGGGSSLPGNADKVNMKNQIFKSGAGCEPATAQVDLDINNVRTTILNGGDMWWNLNNAKYEIPKVTDPNGIRRHSLFSGALWIGGVDAGQNLKVAGQTYRQSGNDFYPGPLNQYNVSIQPERCKAWDNIFKVSRQEIDDFRASDYTNPPANISNWPGNGNPGYGEMQNLAPFVDVNGDGYYNPISGDYPDVFGDQTLWWVYNDKGNIHSETGGVPIGLELQTQAFAFVTNDEVNNMTFYTTTIINRAFEKLDSAYFGQWVDPDLGNYADDYVGCDVSRSLGICYNADNEDEGVLGYGLNPPSIGVDFFEGPKDATGKEIPLSKFVYYNNDFTQQGNPTSPVHYYNYLRGIWKDGIPFTYGGNGRGQGSGATAQRCNFMFPGDTDPSMIQNGAWTENIAGFAGGDRRFLQSAGPFTLLPGAVNRVTVGVVWARTTSGGATGSLDLLKLADDKAQKLFNNNFEILDGPRAPESSLEEYENELVLNLDNTKITESYIDTVKGANNQDLVYKFQGYQIYQLKDATVTTGELEDVEKARLVFQVDIKDNVTQLVNTVFDPKVSSNIKVEKVNGANTGIVHSFRVTKDAFATGSDALINFKSYYFLVVAYANCVNDPNDPDQYIAGRFTRFVSGVPHKIEPRGGGAVLGAKYGDGPQIVRVQGRGNGGNVLELTPETEEEIVKNSFAPNPKYLGTKGPINIKVVDPLRVPDADFEVRIVDKNYAALTQARNQPYLFNDANIVNRDTAMWYIVKVGKDGEVNDTVFSDFNLLNSNEQVIRKWGLAVTIQQTYSVGNSLDTFDQSNGYIESSFEWVDNSKQWLNGVVDVDFNPNNPNSPFNWIRSGVQGRQGNFGKQQYEDDFAEDLDNSGGASPVLESLDPREQFEKVLDRKMAPYRLVSRAKYNNTTGQNTYGPGWEQFTSDAKLRDVGSIDLVLTPDKSKWSRSIVLELCEDAAIAEGNAEKMEPRRAPSKDINGEQISGETGRSWFPGYAINLETGERLNIMFGENSFLLGENGRDMTWNPTSTSTNQSGPVFGGMHYIYVFGTETGVVGFKAPRYDECKTYFDLFNDPTPSNRVSNRRRIWSTCMWVMMSYMSPGFQAKDWKDGLVPDEVRIRVRVKKPYSRFEVSSNPENNGYPAYKFNTGDIAARFTADAGKKALDLINVVPNPYYGYSNYETSQIDNRIKFTNLPKTCTITIYTLNGTMVRKLKKDDEATYLDWDLKNLGGVPIASGMYIIHVDAGDLGEKVLKWFGVMRKTDLDTF